jgi:hypothetical protein
MSAAGQIFAPRQLFLHCPNTRHPWCSSRRQASMDEFTAFLDRHTSHPEYGEISQTGNSCSKSPNKYWRTFSVGDKKKQDGMC